MTHQLSVMDRMRVERVIWSLDQRLYDLPRRQRIARRRELRENLLDAADDVGTDQALRDIGSTSVLAQEYLDAGLGPGPRPSWLAAAVFVMTATLLLTSVLFDAANAYGDGILAGDPSASGTYHWDGVSMLQTAVTYTVADGEQSFVGGAFSPITWALLAIGAVLVGRLWRVLPRFRPGTS